jgi:hypothetical protein
MRIDAPAIPARAPAPQTDHHRAGGEENSERCLVHGSCLARAERRQFTYDAEMEAASSLRSQVGRVGRVVLIQLYVAEGSS